MSKLNGVIKAAEMLQAYIDKQDEKLKKLDDYFERALIIGRKLGAIEYFEEMSGRKLKKHLNDAKEFKKLINK